MKQTETKIMDDAVLQELSELRDDVPPMPDDMHDSWVRAVAQESRLSRPHTGSFTRRAMTRVLSAAAALVFVVGGTILTRDSLPGADKAGKAHSTGSVSTLAERSTASKSVGSVSGGGSAQPAAFYATASSYDMGMSSNEAVMYEAMYEESSPMASNDGMADTRPEKIIRNVSLTLGTRDYDTCLETLRTRCTALGGWISYSYESGDSSVLRRASLTLRIPAEKLDTFLDETSDAGRVINRTESANDVTESYYDTKTRLEAQEALLARLMTLVTEAADLSDLLELEQTIAGVQYKIDSLTSSLRATDRKVDYATVDVSVREERSGDIITTEVTFGERILAALEAGWESLTDFLGDTLVFVTAALPYILLAAAAFFVLRLCIRRRKR